MTENWLQKYKDLAEKSAEGNKPTEAHKQAQESGKDHNEDLRKQQLLHRRAAFENTTPRHLQVSGALGRPEITETGPDGKVITHIRGIKAPDAPRVEPEAKGYAEPPAGAASRSKHERDWNPKSGPLNVLEPSAWSKLQMYAGDVGRANGWSKETGTFPQTNALRHALAAAYVTFNHSALMAVASGDMHEIQTGLSETIQKVPWSNNPKDKSTWKDHDVDINNNLAGAKIAQSILEKGGSWADVERAIVTAIKHLGPNGRIPQPNVTLHNFLNQ